MKSQVDSEISALKKSLDSAMVELEQQKKNITLLEQERNELLQQNRRLKGSLNLESQAKERFKTRIIELEKELWELNRKYRMLHKDLNEQHGGERQLGGYLRDLKNDYVNLKRERDDLRDRYTALESMIYRGYPSHGLLQHQRVAIFVDVQNLYYSAKYIHQSKLSYQKLLAYLTRGRHLIRAIAYVVHKLGSDQDGFLEVLKRSGYEIRIRNLIERSDGSRKGDWDMGIAIDAMALANKVDVVILVSGDGDFLALVSMLKNQGVRVEVASFAESTSEDLIISCHHYWPLETDLLID